MTKDNSSLLFRKEVFAETKRLDAMSLSVRPVRITVLFVVVCVFFIVITIAVPIPQTQTIKAEVHSIAGSVNINSFSEGIISSLNVKLGDRVKKIKSLLQ